MRPTQLLQLCVYLLASVSLGLIIGCGQEQGTAENAGKAIDEAIESTSQSVSEAMENTGEAIKDAAESAEQAVSDAVDGTEKAITDAANDASEATNEALGLDKS